MPSIKNDRQNSRDSDSTPDLNVASTSNQINLLSPTLSRNNSAHGLQPQNHIRKISSSGRFTVHFLI